MRRRRFLTSAKVLAKLFRGWGKCSIGWIAESWRFSCWTWVLKEYPGKLTSRRLVKELRKSHTDRPITESLFKRWPRPYQHNLGRGELDSRHRDQRLEEIHWSFWSAEIFGAGRSSLGQAGLEFYNLCWPHPAQSLLRGHLKVSRKSIVSLVYQAWCKSRALISLAFRRELSKNARTSSTHHLRSKVYRRSASNHERLWRAFCPFREALVAPVANSSSLHCWPEAQCQATFILIEVWNFALQYLVLAVIAFIHKRFELLCATAFKQEHISGIVT